MKNLFAKTLTTVLHINLLDFVIPTGSWLYFATVLAKATEHFIIKSVWVHSTGKMCQSNTFLNCLLETVQRSLLAEAPFPLYSLS